MKEPVSPPAGRLDEDLLRLRVKAELRKRMRGLRVTTPEQACRERSERIISRLHESTLLAPARKVALFWPIESRHEVDLRPLDRDLRARGVQLFYPTIVAPEGRGEGETVAGGQEIPFLMTFKRVDDVARLAEASFGFAEPPDHAPEAREGELDVVVVPALAVDPAGYRIGYGKGYYDRTLPRFAPPAVTIAVAFDFQLISEVPVTSGDVSTDWIVTDRRVLSTRSQGDGA
ncbi:MAG TPA: 5-formyltetrahydrofolate cyclo-ligase [Polyangiaceae bacterium]|nr:5-formyltetrahydrofolate cyclo-ligase [Polyangiaceae bacterium]